MYWELKHSNRLDYRSLCIHQDNSPHMDTLKNRFIRIFRWIYKSMSQNDWPLVHSVSSLLHWLRQVVSFGWQARIHWRSVASHPSLHSSLRLRSLNFSWNIILYNIKHYFGPETVSNLNKYLRTFLECIISVQAARDSHQ